MTINKLHAYLTTPSHWYNVFSTFFTHLGKPYHFVWPLHSNHVTGDSTLQEEEAGEGEEPGGCGLNVLLTGLLV